MFELDPSVNLNDFASEEKCFKEFDSDNKGYLNEDDFFRFLQALVSAKTKLNIADSKQLFRSFDKNDDSKIDASEFNNLWRNWLKKLLKPVCALLVIDMQNDFIDGSLAMRCCSAKQEALEIIQIINNILEKVEFKVVVYSLDYHPENHISFYDNINQYEHYLENGPKIELFACVKFIKPIEMEQKLWPKHCVQNTWGSKLHQDLKVVKNSIMVHKGTKSTIDSYSAFYDNMKLSATSLHAELQQRQVTHVFVCGIAYDYCVAYTALDASELGYATVVVQDATRGTDLKNMEIMTERLKDSNCVVTNSSRIDDYITAKIVDLEFAKVLSRIAC